MANKTFLINDDYIQLGLKQLRSFKASRWVSPLTISVINYFFIITMLYGHDNVQIFVSYIILTLFTTTVIIFITTKAIKRYNNIVCKIDLSENGAIDLNTFSGNHCRVEKEQQRIAYDLLPIKRNKFKVYIVAIGEDSFNVIPEWFNEQKDVELIFQ